MNIIKNIVNYLFPKKDKYSFARAMMSQKPFDSRRQK
jgi:hypothetical protein